MYIWLSNHNNVPTHVASIYVNETSHDTACYTDLPKCIVQCKCQSYSMCIQHSNAVISFGGTVDSLYVYNIIGLYHGIQHHYNHTQ